MLYHAAEEGQGVALGWNILIQDQLKSGRLIAPFEARIDLDQPWGYYLIQSPLTELSPEAIRVRNWIITEAELFKSTLGDD